MENNELYSFETEWKNRKKCTKKQLVNILQCFVCPINKIDWSDLYSDKNDQQIVECILEDKKIPNTIAEIENDLNIVEYHSPIYYAIRSNNTDLLRNMLDQLENKTDDLEDILTRDYHEIRLKEIPLCKEIKYLVVDKIITLHLSKEVKNDKNKKKNKSTPKPCSVDERIQVLNDVVDILNVNISTENKNLFIFKLQFIVKNIQILRKLIKSVQLPWHELEICLVFFIKTYIKHDFNNMFYKCILKKEKMLQYIKFFLVKLQAAKVNQSNTSVKNSAKKNRSETINDILNDTPEFQQLYDDYKTIRDLNSIEKILQFIDEAITADTSKYYDRLAVIRCLQLIGEYLKGTVESPNLSEDMIEDILQYTPHNARKTLKNLRDSLAHSNSLNRLIEMQDHPNNEYFDKILYEIKKIRTVVLTIRYHSKINILTNILQTIIVSEDVEEIKALAGIFLSSDLNNFTTQHQFQIINMLEDSMENIKLTIENITKEENEMFEAINNICSTEKKILQKSYNNFMEAILNLISHSKELEYVTNNDKYFVEQYKLKCQKILENIEKCKDTPKNITFNLLPLFKTINNLSKNSEHYKNLIMCDYWKQSHINNSPGLDTFHNKIKSKISKQQLKIEADGILKNKKEKLKILLNNLDVTNTSTKQSLALEILMLNTLSILSEIRNKILDNISEMDASLPLLVGRNLRNQLAHDNELQRIMPISPMLATLSGAKEINLENLERGYNIPSMTKTEIKSKFDRGMYALITQKEMIDSLKNGNIVDFKNSVKNGADPFFINHDLQTALHIASQGTSIAIVKCLIELKLKIDSCDVRGQTPLQIAVKFGNKHIIEYLIHEGADVNISDDRGATLLHIAAQYGNISIIEMLLENKTDFNLMDKEGYYPLHYSLLHKQKEALSFLLQKEKNPETKYTGSQDTILSMGTKIGDLDIIQVLLQYDSNVNVVNKNGNFPLQYAVHHNNLEVVKVLLDLGANIDSEDTKGWRALHCAIGRNLDILKFLIERGANINYCENNFKWTPIHHAAYKGYLDVVEVLIDAGAEIECFSNDLKTPLHLACLKGHEQIVELLLSRGASIDTKDENDNMALHLSAINGNIKIICMLLKNDTNTLSKNKEGKDPFLHSVIHNHLEAAKIFIKNGVDINTSDAGGISALHYSVFNENLEMVQLLIENKANLDIVDDTKATPLHVVAATSQFLKMRETFRSNIVDLYSTINNDNEDENEINQYIKSCTTLDNYFRCHPPRELRDQSEASQSILKVLIENGADVNVVDVFDQTPLHFAATSGNLNAINALLDNEAGIEAKNCIGQTPLLDAVLTNRVNVVQELIKRNSNLNVIDQNGMTPLTSALEMNYEEIAKILLEKGADVNTGEKSPLLISIQQGSTELVNILLENDNIEIKPSYLRVAIVLNHFNIVELLLEKNEQLKNESEFLFLAIWKDNNEIVKAMLNKGADINSVDPDGDSLLHFATMYRNCEITDLLLSKGANINATNKDHVTVFNYSIAHFEKQSNTFETLLKYIDIKYVLEEYGKSLLYTAMELENSEAIQYLLDKIVELEIKDAIGLTNQKELIEYLLNSNYSNLVFTYYLNKAVVTGDNEEILKVLSLDITPKEFDTSFVSNIIIPSNNINTETIKIILKQCAMKCDMDTIRQMKIEDNKRGQGILEMLILTDLLFEAIENNDWEAVENLIQKGACIDAINSEYMSPLHLACIKGNEAIVELLLKAGADVEIVGPDKKIPLDFAAKHLEIVSIFQKHGHKLTFDSNICKTDV